MAKIEKFYEFNKVSDTLHAFDFDDTLFETPKWEDVAKKFIFENNAVKDLVDIALSEIGNNKSKLKTQDGRIFLEDPLNAFSETKNWIRKGSRLYLVQPDKFTYLDESLPTELKNISKIYKEVENKCIITARPESMRDKIETVLKNSGLEYPKFGLCMCPDGRVRAGVWKGEKICEISKKFKFNEVIFYDDNSKYLRDSKRVVSEKMPQLIFKTVKVF